MENKEDLKMQRTYYTIKGEKFYLPEELDYVQWKHVKIVMSKAGITLKDLTALNDEAKKVDIKATIGKVIDVFTEKDLIPIFFAIILIPKDAEYWEEKYIENFETMKRIGDKTMGEVLVRFLSGRESLVITIMDFLTNFLSGLTKSEKKLKD